MRKRVLPVVALVVLGAGAWYGWQWWTVGRFMVSTDDAYVGAENATLAAKVAAFVASVPVEANQHVKAGDPIVVLDDGDYRLALDGAEAKLATQQATLARIDQQIAAAKIGIDQAKAQQDAAAADTARTEADFERARDLYQRQAGAKATLDTATAARDRARATETAAKSAVAAAELNVAVLEAQRAEASRVAAELRVARDQAKRNLDFTVVRAPFDGVIANKGVQVGDYVTAGKRLASLVPLDQIYVDANFKETQLAGIRPGGVAHLHVDAFPDRDIVGTVTSLAPGSGSIFSLLPPENATGNFTKIVQRVPVRIAVPADIAREGLLRPGLSVIVDVDTRTP
ncbi:HlyD family secretion protein [Rhodovulum sp. PH10]|uniref:HlyD family secretion protein n=1 Tax=Rhodovulum sp. PH10 TaxID=1187851 RepID=UPI000313691F|nr:HlyD family secretion protein [Rhodovulum sp. PH10]